MGSSQYVWMMTQVTVFARSVTATAINVIALVEIARSQLKNFEVVKKFTTFLFSQNCVNINLYEKYLHYNFIRTNSLEFKIDREEF